METGRGWTDGNSNKAVCQMAKCWNLQDPGSTYGNNILGLRLLPLLSACLLLLCCCRCRCDWPVVACAPTDECLTSNLNPGLVMNPLNTLKPSLPGILLNSLQTRRGEFLCLLLIWTAGSLCEFLQGNFLGR